MFVSSNLATLLQAGPLPTEPPQNVPPPTLVNLPRCLPQDTPTAASGVTVPPPPSRRPLAAELQAIIRPTSVSLAHLHALGVHVTPDASLTDLIPDPACVPDFAAWDAMSLDEARAANPATQKPLNTGKPSPGCFNYLNCRRELSIENLAAFRVTRRIPPLKGQPAARLGNSFDFFRHLDLFSTFWQDTSRPAPEDDGAAHESPGQTNGSSSGSDAEPPKEYWHYRTNTGALMPMEYRMRLASAFLKLVTYDFGCNVSAPRTEPKMQVASPAMGRSSYFSSGCTFIFRTPQTREAARAGCIEGPVAAISARSTTSFPPTPAEAADAADATSPASPDQESVMDLARELVAALITAQHRAREGRTEKRVGEGAWWTTKPRWGGGPGGPIGREVDMQQSGTDDAAVGDKDMPPPPPPSQPLPSPSSSSSSPSLPTLLSSSPPVMAALAKGPKRLKKSGGQLSMYDNYRAVRPPAPAWDKKTRYEAFGRVRGADYDDVFVVSALFHHISILRVRVPDRLLAALEGDDDGEVGAEADADAKPWGRLEVRRSRWFDLFKTDDRIAAVQSVWAMMSYLMRENAPSSGENGAATTGQDVKMAGA